MGNCLVTKLRGNVSNDNLPSLGSFIFDAYAGNNSCTIGIVGLSESTTVKILGNGVFTDTNSKTKTVTFPSDGTEVEMSFTLAEDCKIEIMNISYDKKINFIYNGNYDISNAVKFRPFQKIYKSGGSAVFNLDDIEYPSTITQLFCMDSKVIGDLSKFQGINISTYFSVWNNNITGDIINLANMVSTQTIQCGYSSIYGIVEDLLLALKNNGKTGTFSFSVINSNATFNNAQMSNDCKVTISENTITVKDAYNDSIVLGTYDGSTWTYRS